MKAHAPVEVAERGTSRLGARASPGRSHDMDEAATANLVVIVLSGHVGLLLAVLSIPLLLGKVEPNPWYGFRTRKTLSRPEIWYPANRFAGRVGVLAGGAIVLVSVVVGIAANRQPWVMGALLGVVLAALLGLVSAGLWYVRRL